MDAPLRGIPEVVRQLARAVSSAGGELWIVGGWVRDRLLDREPRDLDLVCFGLEAAVLDPLLRSRGGLQLVGRTFPVRKWFAGGRVHDVQLAPAGVNLAADAAQRDLCVNALYCDPLRGQVEDPLGGVEDLRTRRLRITGPAFSADPVRKLRLVRACVRLEAEAEEEAWRRARAMVLGEVARERIFEELRALLATALPLERVPALWSRAGLASDWPELAFLRAEDDALAAGRRLSALRDALSAHPDPFLDLLAELAASIEEPAARTTWLERILDERVSAEVVARLARDARLSELSLALAGADASAAFAIDLELVALARKHGPLAPAIARLQGRANERAAPCLVAERVTRLTLLDGKPDPWITGRELQEQGLRPGPHFAPLLDRALTHQLRGDWSDRQTGLRWLAGELGSESAKGP
ncbi:MAG: CCA tRNA nucleotidyltransferase [Planctomycetes bacterium]|nr:CCA tRNA nucleotidyltransferase [Planctomycetota bacterium]